MGKIPFDIKFRPQIESGEYKVETRDGRPVRIICWDKKSEKKYGYHIVGLIEYGPQHEESTYYTIDGKGRLKDKEPELFLITPEPELSAFEKAVLVLCEDMFQGPVGKEEAKERAAELLKLAREGYVPRVEKEHIAINEFLHGVEVGRKEALKDLPRWSEKDEEMIKLFIRHTQKEFNELCNDRYGHQEIISDLKESCRERMNWLENMLKSLRPQSYWKPNKEQMDALADATMRDVFPKGNRERLESLYEDLQKLM